MSNTTWRGRFTGPVLYYSDHFSPVDSELSPIRCSYGSRESNLIDPAISAVSHRIYCRRRAHRKNARVTGRFRENRARLRIRRATGEVEWVSRHPKSVLMVPPSNLWHMRQTILAPLVRELPRGTLHLADRNLRKVEPQQLYGLAEFVARSGDEGRSGHR